MVAVFYLPGARALRPYLLIGASFVFYGLSGMEHAMVLLAGILWVYFMVRSDAITGNLPRLVIAVVPPVAALFYYKYLGFVIRQFLDLENGVPDESFDMFANIVLPAGISFFTFQLVSFAIDRYRGHVPELPRFRHFMLYVSFFPQLVAGPILRFHQVEESLRRLREFNLPFCEASKAIGYICLGLAAKVLIADSLSNYQAPLVADPGGLSAIAGIYVVLAYSFQIYFDFYGYSLIAIGLGALFGFQFPKNFDRPYEALNERDFWRRWHLTLSYWIRDYLYLPLGGNERYLRNILIVFVLCGLWHGAGWTFIVWGLYHAVMVLCYHLTARWWDLAPRLVQQAVTFALVSLGWILFLFDFSEVRLFADSLLGIASVTQPDPGLEMWAMLILAAWACFGLRFEAMAETLKDGTTATLRRSAGYALLFVAVLIFLDRSQTFIYFRF